MKQVARVLSKSWIPAAAVLVALLLLTSPSSFGNSRDLSVESCTATANVVTTVVRNSGTEDRQGVLTVGAVVDGQAVMSRMPFTVGSGQTASISVGFRSDVSKVIALGISEDWDPF